MKIIYYLLIFSLFTSCFKTAEEIKREKQIDKQLEQSSTLVAELGGQVQNLQNQLALATGQLEEIDHKTTQSNQKNQQSLSQTLDQLTAQVKVLLDDSKEMKQKIAKLESDNKSQKKYIKNVTGTLSSLSGSKTKSSLASAHQAFTKNQKKTAYTLYLKTLEENQINNAQKNHVYFNLGLLEYWNKEYEKALVYFSKIYTKYPKSSFSPRSLLYIARSFKAMNKPEEATVSYQELIDKYPKTNHAKTAQKEIK